MDRNNNIRLALSICFLLWPALSISGVVADDAIPQAIPAVKSAEQPAVQSSKAKDEPLQEKQETLPTADVAATTTETLETRFPYLQRALIILTIINFVAIIFASLMYLVKRRMQQFSPAPLARLNQEV